MTDRELIEILLEIAEDEYLQLETSRQDDAFTAHLLDRRSGMVHMACEFPSQGEAIKAAFEMWIDR